MAQRKTNRTKKKHFPQITTGIAHIHSTFNNTIVSVADEAGHVLTWSSAGALGYKGTRKSTPHAAQLVAEEVAKTAMERYKMSAIHIKVKGPGPGRDTAIRSLANVGLNVVSIKDVTPVPHNGVRPRKRPRG